MPRTISSLLLCFSIVASAGPVSAKKADTSEEFAVNLWTSTCAVADSLDKFTKLMNKFDVERLNSQAAKHELVGEKGAAWRYKAPGYGNFFFAWRDTGECMISTSNADAANAKKYFDAIVRKSVPDDWKIQKTHEALDGASDRVTYKMTADSGRKATYDLYTSTDPGTPRQLLIVTKYQ
jgi:hypothetical protein